MKQDSAPLRDPAGQAPRLRSARSGRLGPATYSNPVIDSDFPDPSILKARDGFYYAYATQTERDGAMINVQVARSADMVHWEHVGDALPEKPRWADRTQDFWAPNVMEADGRYFLYYSSGLNDAVGTEAGGMCVAVATADRPQGPFVDVGRPLVCGEGFVNIDPVAFDDPATGKRLLYWGSGFEPIRVRELAPDRISFAPGSEAVELIFPTKRDTPDGYQHLVEAASVVRHGGWYYLLYSGDECCGPDPHYAVMVARSRSATGPFEPQPTGDGEPSRLIVDNRGSWEAPGHCGVVMDAAGDHWIVYHAVDPESPRVGPDGGGQIRRVMLIDRLEWRDGWPAVDGPSKDPRPAPATLDPAASA